jgi:tetratricopeptide (TPR) repeat protein
LCADEPARRHFGKCLAALALSVAASGTLAQRPLTPAPSPQPIARPQIVIVGGAEQPVRLRAVRIESEITGTLAISTIEMRFFNPNARMLEGELQFPLVDGQTVVGFAMDVDGVLRDAVPVDKPRAQAVFEDITRARIDPGLLQVTQGNNFKLRVYPLNPRGEKLVRVRIAESLVARDGKRHLVLPLDYGNGVDSFALAVYAPIGVGAPRVVRSGAGAIAFSASGDKFAATLERRDFTASGPLELALDGPSRASVELGQHAGKAYFYAEVPFRPTRAARAAPRVIGLIWDSSGSAANRDRARELAFLDALFRRVGDVEVRLMRLRDRAEPTASFDVRKGDWRALRAALAATPYDGATNFGALVPDARVNHYLLVSDGLSNFGDAPLPTLAAPVHTIASAPKADPALLRHIADRSGGRYVDLARVSAAEAANTILAGEERVIDLSSDGATDLVVASPYAQNGLLTVAGVLTEPRATLRIRTGGVGAERIIEVPLRADPRATSPAPWLWARLRVASLEGQYALHRAEIRRIGKAFGLPTRETSLIILDRIEDYARFEIEPPAPLREQYERVRATMVRQVGDQKRSQLERVVRMLQEKEAWWQRDFPKEARPASIAKPEPGAAAGARERQAEQRTGNLMQDRADLPREESARRTGPVPQAAAPAAPPMAGLSVQSNASRDAALADGRVAKQAGQAANAIAIQLKPWTSDSPYAKRLREADASELYALYLDERASYTASTAFFLDAAELFFAKGQSELGLRVLSNLAEMDLENRHILRILGYRLLQANEPKLAVAVFKRVLELAPEEPQSYRDLGLAYAADKQHQKAIDMLYEVVERPWHGRFPEIELIALAELNAILATTEDKLDTSRIDPRLMKNLPLDLRVVLAWDADNTDIDLWVTDPNGEKAYYGHRFTYQGGRMSADFTGGYGPEEFSLKLAKPGKYKVQAQFYGHRQQIVAGATTLMLKLSTRFGTTAQQDQAITLRLRGQSEVIQVGEFEVK